MFLTLHILVSKDTLRCQLKILFTNFIKNFEIYCLTNFKIQNMYNYNGCLLAKILLIMPFRSEDQIQLVEFITASMATQFGPLDWATKLLKKKKIFDFKVLF